MIQISAAKCSMQLPALFIDKPDVNITQSNKKRSYAPYENIKTCIQNNYEDSIYLPSHSVFSINLEDIDEEDPMRYLDGLDWETKAIELKPKEFYCNDYDLTFSEPGNDYYITAQYCRSLENYEDPIIFERDCQQIFTVSSNALIASCPKEVDCFPLVDEVMSSICSNLDLFAISCPRTTILY